MNDIAKLRRLMRRANYIRHEHPANGNLSIALTKAWWFESFRDALSNGFARFTYRKKDGTTRTALGTLDMSLIPEEQRPKGIERSQTTNDQRPMTFPYFDLDKNEWRSFNVLNFVSLDNSWRFNDPLA